MNDVMIDKCQRNVAKGYASSGEAFHLYGYIDNLGFEENNVYFMICFDRNQC